MLFAPLPACFFPYVSLMASVLIKVRRHRSPISVANYAWFSSLFANSEVWETMPLHCTAFT